MIRVLVAEPGSPPQIKEISGKLREYQDLVGGYIQTLHMPDIDGVMLICDEEGKLKDLEPNFELYNNQGRVVDVVVGTVVFVGDDEDDFSSLTDDQVQEVKDYLDREDR